MSWRTALPWLFWVGHLAACQSAVPDAAAPPDGTPAIASATTATSGDSGEAAGPPIDWTQGQDCLAKLELLELAVAQDQLYLEDPTPFAVVGPDPSCGAGAGGASLSSSSPSR